MQSETRRICNQKLLVVFRASAEFILKKVKADTRSDGKTVKLTPKATQDLEHIWYYGYHNFGE